MKKKCRHPTRGGRGVQCHHGECGQRPTEGQNAIQLAYQDMAHGMRVKQVVVSNPYTTQVLYRLGFKWSPTTWDYVDRMLNAISGLGFFD